MSYEKLSKINVNEHVETKGQFSYLSWAWAVDELLKVDPNATWEVAEYDGVPYIQSPAGCFVKVSVKVGDVVRTQIHPVLDNRNKTVREPDAFQINTSIQRCLVKAIALHGLGLYIYAGEDLPFVSKIEIAADYLKKLIDQDCPEETHQQIKDAWEKFERKYTHEDCLKLQNLLKEKAPDSNRMYSTLLKDHLNYSGEAA